MEIRLEDNDLCLIILRRSNRARRYTIKIAKGAIEGIMPLHGSEEKMVAFIQEKKEFLKKALLKSPPPFRLNEETNFSTLTFSLHIFRSERNNFYSTFKNNILHIACPAGTDFEDTNTQQTLHTIIQKALTYEAKRVLPERLAELARQYNFQVTSVAINNSKKRWGSCNSEKKINLSSSLLLLPAHLVDYVLLHELCHTKEMNHGKDFWNLMDQVTDGTAKKLRQELKNHHTF
ncbi:MAG: M48 family metallopeptidase [Tannerellaceae bacterium]|nr:M48 family metallopeptidase [Tannerellaceae bacterium]